MHEIVTLQFGQQANYVGTHFWNTQESYFTYPPEEESPVNHDILFRPGLAPDGTETFTPRTLIYDLKGAFGGLRKTNALYEPEDPNNDPSASSTSIWPSKPIIHRASQRIQPSEYQTHLEAGLNPPPLSTSSVRYWSDYSRLYYHPKSLIQLSEFDVNDSLMPFQRFDVGWELFEKLEREQDLVDRDLRPFIEECDLLQGIQMWTGVEDAWGGWASAWMERLRDEFGKVGIWSWGFGKGEDGVLREKRLEQIANSARSLQVLGEQSSVYIPVSLNPVKRPSYLSLDTGSQWHTGALQAIGMESMTMPSRLRVSNGTTLQDMEETFNGTGKRRIAKFELSIANPEALEKRRAEKAAQATKAANSSGAVKQDRDAEQQDLSSFDMDVFLKNYKVESRKARRKEHIFGRVETWRGEWDVPEDSGKDPRDRFAEEPTVRRFSAPLLFPVLDSFPSIFQVGGHSTQKLAVYSGLSTTTSVANQIRSLEQIVRRMISLEERETLSNGLQVLAEEYDEGYDSGMESSEDED